MAATPSAADAGVIRSWPFSSKATAGMPWRAAAMVHETISSPHERVMVMRGMPEATPRTTAVSSSAQTAVRPMWQWKSSTRSALR